MTVTLTEQIERKKDPIDDAIGRGPKEALSLDKELMFALYLARDVLGYEEVTSLHVGWFRELLTNPRLLLLAPRGHFKTTVVTVAYPIYRILKDRSVRILIINEVLENAKDFLSEIKGHILDNEKFIDAYGRFDKNASRWTQKQITLTRDRSRKDPTIAVGGTLGAINSKHADLIIVDDPVSIKNVTTLHQRKKLFTWFRQVLIPILEPDGQLVVTGTRWHQADLYSEILNDKEESFKDWRKVILRAHNDDYSTILFPERYDQAKLEQLKREMGTPLYNSQYLNDPSGIEGQSFKFDWLKFFKTPPAEMTIYQGVDLAISKNEGAAFFVVITIGIPVEGDIYVLDIHRERLDFPAQCQVIKRKGFKFSPSMIGIENNSYQDAMPQWLRADPEAKALPLHATPSSGDKIRRIASLAPLFERGVIRIMEDQHNFIDEFLAFPKGSTFDILDALLQAIEASKAQDTEPTITEINL